MLNEYISLKEQKVMMDQERARLEHEKCRVQTLLQGMQSVMSAYNAGASAPLPMLPSSSTNSMVTVPFNQSFIGTLFSFTLSLESFISLPLEFR